MITPHHLHDLAWCLFGVLVGSLVTIVALGLCLVASRGDSASGRP